MPIYRCNNYGECELADRRERIELAKGAPAVCPERNCRRPLLKLPDAQGRALGVPIIGLVAGALALVALLGVVVNYGFGRRESEWQTSQSAIEAIEGYDPAGDRRASGVAALSGAKPNASGYDLVFAGSNTIGGLDAGSQRSLIRDLLAGFCKQNWPGGALGDEALLEARSNQEPERTLSYKLPTGETKRFLIRAHGSKTAVDGLRASDPRQHADVGMSSTPLTELRSGFYEYVVALDAVAVIVHAENPLSELTLDQLRDMFEAKPKTAQWPGGGGAIHTFGRDKNSGTTESFRSFLRATQPPSPQFAFEESGKVVDQVSRDRAAIGYVGRADNLSQANVKTLAVRASAGYPAFAPTPTTIRTMEYAMTRELYLYIARSAPPLASAFVAYSLSDAGQAIANEAGFIGFSSASLLAPADLAASAPEPLQLAVADSERVLIAFRFSQGAELDTVSARNLKRLTALLAQPLAARRELIVVGHVDSTGNPQRNLELSKKRAQSFIDLLKSRGVTNPIAPALGFGSSFLLYDDHGDAGSREARLNRRVDVYLKR